MDIKNEVMASGGSVATSAMHICMYLGAKNIVFVGQDLAYGDKLVTHAGESSTGYNDNRTKVYVEGIDGNEVISRTDWISFLKYIEEVIINNPNIRFIDATEGGALIHGTEVLTLKDTIEQLSDADLDIDKLFDLPLIGDREMLIVDEYTNKIKKQLLDCKSDMETCTSLCEKIIQAYDKRKLSEAEYHVKKYLEVSGKINSLECMYDIYCYCIEENRDLITSMHVCQEDEKTTWINYYKIKKKIYENYLKVIPDLLELMSV